MPKITSKYQTKKEHLNILGVEIDILRITNLDDLFNDLLSKGDQSEDVKDERIPYWADLWASAIALSQHIVKSNLIKPRCTVLEIGCGLGLPGIIAGKLGAKVIFTDYVSDALEFAKQNWMLNHNQAAGFKIMDWRKPNATLAADILLASDVAYESRMFKHLERAFKKLITNNGIILLSEPNRKFSQPLFTQLKEKGFDLKKIEYKVELNQMITKVNVFEIRKKFDS